MKKILLILILFGLIFNSCDAQRNFAAKKLLFGQVQKPYINFGYLYNRYAIIDSRKITSSDDWRIPIYNNSNQDYEILSTYLGGESIAGGKLKSTGFVYWNSPNTGSTNESNFNARGSGLRGTNGTFSSLNSNLLFWIIFSPSPTSPQGVTILYNSASLSRGLSSANNGQSIRLIKNTTTLTNGQSGTYIGNDGKIYRTICIGTQDWLADNLTETKYRDGSIITVVTDNTAWAALTTEARCVYNNDEKNR